jgi:hypothetical protein
MDGDQVELTPAEYPLLGILANRAGNLVTNHRLVEDFGDHPPIIVTSNVSASWFAIYGRGSSRILAEPGSCGSLGSVIVSLNVEMPQLPPSTIPCESVNAQAKDARLGSKEIVQGV